MAEDDDTGGEEDLQLAWEVAEMARLAIERDSSHADVTRDVCGEAYELLGDIGAERDAFDEAVSDYASVCSCPSPRSTPPSAMLHDWRPGARLRLLLVARTAVELCMLKCIQCGGQSSYIGWF